MLRSLFAMVLLFFLAFGLAGMNLLLIQEAFVESADGDSSAGAREEEPLEDTNPGRIRERAQMLARVLCSPANRNPSVNPEITLFASLSPPYRDTGNVHGVLKVFRI